MTSVLSNLEFYASSWQDMSSQWIGENDKYRQVLASNVIDRTFPVLNDSDKKILLDGLILVINFIKLKYFPGTDSGQSFWKQLVQNDYLDARALLASTLPYIDDDDDVKKKSLTKLEDLYVSKNEKGEYIYTNSQYNRCVRYYDNNKIAYVERPYLIEYYQQHLEMLLMSIDASSNKLYVNWVDVLPIAVTQIQKSPLYQPTVDKIKNRSALLMNGYIDLMPGISYQDIYNVISNHLYHDIKNYKWIIYDAIIDGKAVPYVEYLEQQFTLDDLWKKKGWSQLSDVSRNTFIDQWNKFLSSTNVTDNIILSRIYFFFCKYHRNTKRLVRSGQLILTTEYEDIEDIDEDDDIRITPDVTRNAKVGLNSVPAEEIYLFFYDQFTAFRRSWYYYVIYIKKQKYLESRKVGDENNTVVFVTPKNVYNWSKSLTHYVDPVTGYTEIPKYWSSLQPELISMVMIRMLDMLVESNDKRYYNRWKSSNWFNINGYLRRIYPELSEKHLPRINEYINDYINSHLVDIVMESMAYHGILSTFQPNPKITDRSIIASSVSLMDDVAVTSYRRNEMKRMFFSGSIGETHRDHAYYYLTATAYGQLAELNNGISYFDFLSSQQIWTFTYAMNWASQINFYHHYANNRVMYITGATGVGKSTQTPKLLMYCQKMMDYNQNGKIICTQPRVPPTVANAETIARELGVPIKVKRPEFTDPVPSSNYDVQYKHQNGSHIGYSDAFLKIVTDGTLYSEIQNSPFLTRSQPDKTALDVNNKPIDWIQTYSSNNIYDIVIVDEAHEHNANMDMILTLSRDSAYVNNSLKIVIVSATMEKDESIYRRYYRTINDNRAYPLNEYIESLQLDRANIDRRIHISPPGQTTQYEIRDHYLSASEAKLITPKNYVDKGIEKTIQVVNTTQQGDVLLFLAGRRDILRAVNIINRSTPVDVIAMGYYSQLDQAIKDMIINVHDELPKYTRYKEDVELPESEISRRVPPGTYRRVVIVATNVAEASITIKNLKYVIDTGYAKSNIYDPIEGVSKMKLLPISLSSSMQRRGRVGRVASGDVYYLYDKAKIAENATSYKITQIDALEVLMPLMRREAADIPIITYVNDVNNIYNLTKIRRMFETINVNNPETVYRALSNPRPYMNIIKNRYLRIPDLDNIQQYYTYYGVSSNTTNILNNPIKYFQLNHDDYDFQANQKFISRTYTGYDDIVLIDQDLSFYLIHPDESVITRNPYTGSMVGIQDNESVSESYYYYLLKFNHIETDQEIKLSNINFNKFSLPKYYIAVDKARQELLMYDIPHNNTLKTIHYANVTPIGETMTAKFLESTRHLYKFPTTTITSSYYKHMRNISTIYNIPDLEYVIHAAWYCYGITKGVENDVIGMLILMRVFPSLRNWKSNTLVGATSYSFYETHRDVKGDLHFVWNIWEQLRQIINSWRLEDVAEIGPNTFDEFTLAKNDYLSGNKNIDLMKWKIIDEMYHAGVLNTHDEYYEYVTMTPTKIPVMSDNVVSQINNIADRNLLDRKLLMNSLIEYLTTISVVKKNVWEYEYSVEHDLIDENDTAESELDWIRQHLSLPGYYSSTKSNSRYDAVLESYIRAFSSQLLWNRGRYYIKLSRGSIILPSTRSKRDDREGTVTANSNEFLIYYSSSSIDDDVTVSYLTPVQFEWVIRLNPIFYYYIFYDPEYILRKIPLTPSVKMTLDLVERYKSSFDVNALMAYLEGMGDVALASEIRRKMM